MYTRTWHKTINDDEADESAAALRRKNEDLHGPEIPLPLVESDSEQVGAREGGSAAAECAYLLTHSLGQVARRFSICTLLTHL